MEKSVYVSRKISKGKYMVTSTSHSCAACHSRLFCSARSSEFEVFSDIDCREGDRVLVYMNSVLTIASTFIVFGIPLVALGAGIVIGVIAFKSDLYAAFISLFFLACSFFLVKRLGKSESLTPRIVRVLDSFSVAAVCDKADN